MVDIASITGLLGGSAAHSLGLKVGEYLGKKIVLGACVVDGSDDLDPRPFQAKISTSKLPPGVDLRRWMTPVEDQGAIGSCTSNALASAIEYLALRGANERVDVSRLFMYYNQRLWRGRVRDDNGAAISWGIRCLARLGVPHEKMWPYDPNLFAVQPPAEVYAAAHQHRVVDWAKVPVHLDAVRACLAGGFPITMGTRTFGGLKLKADAIVAMPDPSDDDGSHAMLIAGYDDREKLFIVRNSWGEDWGDKGYCYMPYDYVLNTAWTHSMWSILLGADLTFEEAEHAAINLSAMPKAPPSRGASGPVNPQATPANPLSAGGLFGALGALSSGGNPLSALLGGATAVETVAGLATSYAGVAVTAATGNATVGNLVGGVVRGLAPAVVSEVQRDDAGATVGEDRSKEILAALRGEGEHAAPPPSPPRYHWDDGLDEEATSQGRASSASQTAPAPASPGGVPGFGAAPAVGGVFPGFSAAPAAGGGFPGFGAAPAPAAPPAPSAPVAASPAQNSLVERWSAAGGEAGPLGARVLEPQPAPDGKGAWLACSKGALVQRPDGAIFAVLGPIYEVWYRMGSFTSPLRYPSSEELDTGDPRAPRASRFDGGTLYFTPGYGAWFSP